MSVIGIEHLTKNYGKARSVIDVSLSVEQGEVFGFIGPNGAGKSTTIRTLPGLIYPTSRSARIFGKSCTTNPEVREDVRYLPSEVFYYDGMRVIDLLRYSASFYRKDCSKRINELAEIMDLDLKKGIDDLSFGNKTKVGIVQGLIHEPRLIILDEPTTGLDPLMQQAFFDLIASENKKGATIFLSSHILREVQKMCERVALIKDGRIIKLERMSALQENNLKRTRVEGLSDLDKTIFGMPGVSKLENGGKTASFLFKGDINRVIRKLAQTDVSNLSIDEPDIEEIFMHYYSKDG